MYLSNVYIIWKLGFLSIGVGTVAFSDTDKNSIFKIWFLG